MQLLEQKEGRTMSILIVYPCFARQGFKEPFYENNIKEKKNKELCFFKTNHEVAWFSTAHFFVFTSSLSKL
jgi:hypothetical protein